MRTKIIVISLLFISIVILQQCKKDPPLNVVHVTVADTASTTKPYTISIPQGFPTLVNIPFDNPLTVEGISLGKKLFYDSILSGNNKQSCASCHAQPFAFSDHSQPFSKGIAGNFGTRNAPPIFNVLWGDSFFWDGRAGSLEEQALGPVPNPNEMNLSWDSAVSKLKRDAFYPTLFKKAFSTNQITKELVVKAIAQFERTYISANSKYDKWLRHEVQLDSSELRGYNIFFTETGDCFHCHGTVLFTDNLFHNNGLDAFPGDPGRANVTFNSADQGKFKTPSLRNLEYTGPYMHDSRFTTLQQVVDFYSSGLKYSATIDPLMKKVSNGGVQLNAQQKQDLIAFLKTLSDPSFIANPEYAP